MRFFIDFEATEHKEIMSIGCISECGDTFYSLVRPQEEYKDWYIKKLTGIHNKELSVAPDVNEVFKEFYNWIINIDNSFDIYCYGENDIDFIVKSLSTADSFNAIAGLLLIKDNLIDFSHTFIDKISLNNCSLQDAHLALISNSKQDHNSLNDAIMLKNIFNYSFNKSSLEETIIRGCKKKKVNKTTAKKKKKQNPIILNIVSVYDLNRNLINTFNSYAEAIRWMRQSNTLCQNILHQTTKRIKKHIQDNTPYNNYYFKVERKECLC